MSNSQLLQAVSSLDQYGRRRIMQVLLTLIIAVIVVFICAGRFIVRATTCPSRSTRRAGSPITACVTFRYSPAAGCDPSATAFAHL